MKGERQNKKEKIMRKTGEIPIRKRNRVPPADESFAYEKQTGKRTPEGSSIRCMDLLSARNPKKGNPINRTHEQTVERMPFER